MKRQRRLPARPVMLGIGAAVLIAGHAIVFMFLSQAALSAGIVAGLIVSGLILMIVFAHVRRFRG